MIIGKKANITYVNSLLEINNSFESLILYQKSVKNYVRNITKGYDILITTRIDYDDRIYYDAVNDIRKSININKPVLLYGYNRGVYYFEKDNKYYEFYDSFHNEGAMSIFFSLIIVLNKVNDSITIYNLGSHTCAKRKLLKYYNLFGIKKLDYEPLITDSGSSKFVWVRQKFSGYYNYTKYIQKNLKQINFNLNNFYGK